MTQHEDLCVFWGIHVPGGGKLSRSLANLVSRIRDPICIDKKACSRLRSRYSAELQVLIITPLPIRIRKIVIPIGIAITIGPCHCTTDEIRSVVAEIVD